MKNESLSKIIEQFKLDVKFFPFDSNIRSFFYPCQSVLISGFIVLALFEKFCIFLQEFTCSNSLPDTFHFAGYA